MRIAIVSHIRHAIAAPFMGGMEAHSHMLATVLRDRGHDVTLFASGDSKPDAGIALEPIVARHYDAIYPWHDFHGTEVLNTHLDTAYGAVLAKLTPDRFDVVHNNSLHRYLPRHARQTGMPMLTSLHVPPFKVLHRAVEDSIAPWCHFTVCSQDQLNEWWPEHKPEEGHVVYNGIDLAKWDFVAQGDGTAVWVGRITPTKGTGPAVQAARRAGVRLRIYGVIEHQDYFETEVAPYLDERITYEGHLDQSQLRARIGAASVALFTPCWNEPFGLVAAEAMACGVPVAGFARGAAAEVTGNAGRLVPEGDIDALAEAIKAAGRIDRAMVRRRVAENFSLDTMVSSYEGLYDRACRGAASFVAPRRFAPYELPEPQPLVAE